MRAMQEKKGKERAPNKSADGREGKETGAERVMLKKGEINAYRKMERRE